MAPELIGKCPICSQDLEVTELECPVCHTKLSGHFDPCKFCKLSPEQRSFAEIFIKNRGNIKEVERELGISYPTVRARLEGVIRALGYTVDDNVPQDVQDAGRARQKKEILERLARGEISAQEAARLIKSIGSK